MPIWNGVWVSTSLLAAGKREPGRGREKRGDGASLPPDSPWDRYCCRLLKIHPPFFLLIKSWLCFPWQFAQPDTHVTGSCSEGWQNYSLTMEVPVEFCWDFGKDWPPEKRGKSGQWSYLTASPTLKVATMSSGSSHLAIRRQQSGNSQRHLLTSFTHGPNPAAISFRMSGW